MEPIYERLIIPKEHALTPIKKDEAEWIYSFLKGRHIKKTLEVGFSLGCSAAHIISATHSKHYVIDPYQYRFKNLGLKNIKKLCLSKYIRLEKDFSHNALPRLVGKGVKIDFAFIDGGHKFDEIFIDFYYIDLLLNNKGYVLFHDTWMRSTQLVASWIIKNKTNYKQVKMPMRNMIMFQKKGKDIRPWGYFKEFYTLKSIIINKLFNLSRILRRKRHLNYQHKR